MPQPKSTVHPISSGPETRENISRRELVKALTALGGATAASSLLPQKWAKPEVGAGVLPAHAQSTQNPPPPTCAQPLLSQIAYEWVDPAQECDPGSLRARFTFAYADASGNVISGQTSLRLHYRFESGTERDRADVEHTVGSDPFAGIVQVFRCITFSTSSYIDYTFWLTNACGLESAPITVRVLRPQTYTPSNPRGGEQG